MVPKIKNEVEEKNNKGCHVTVTPLLSDIDHARIQFALRFMPEVQLFRYNEKERAPLHVKLRSDFNPEPYHTDRAVYKQSRVLKKSGSTFNKFMDPMITDAQRELLAYHIDRAFGFDLVPPVVIRPVGKHGSGSLQSWVSCMSGGQWARDYGYDYKQNTNNPWMHRLAAFDILIGSVDRHAGNWLMDKEGRVFAIDNGYSFPKRTCMGGIKCLPLRGLQGVSVSDDTRKIISRIKEEDIFRIMHQYPFRCNEPFGVCRRLQYLKGLRVWQPIGR